MASQGILIEVPGAEHVDNTVTIDGASMLPSSMQGVGYEPEGGGPMQYSLVELGKRLLSSSRDGDTAEVKALIQKGAPFTTDWLGTSPLHLAAKYGHTETCAILLRAGISKDARTKVDKTPVHVAAQEGHADVLELLLKNAADIEAVDMINMTALHWAVDRGNVSAVETLLKFGADINAESKFDKTPLEIASDNARPDIYEMLQNAEQFRAMMPPITAQDKIVPHMSDPATLAATRSIALDNSPHPGLEDLELATETSTVPNSQKTEAMKLLEAHGITLLPEDAGSSSNMIHSGGRATLALSEAGKMVLSSSSSASASSSSAQQHNKGTTIVKSVTARKLAAPSGSVQKPTIVRLSSGVNAASGAKVSTPTVTRVVRASTVFGANSPSSSTAKSATTGGIVVRSGAAHAQSQQNKAPRIIKISPEQFAALKSGTAGAKIGGLLSPSKSQASPMSTAAISTTATTTTRLISSAGGISRFIATSGPTSGTSSSGPARKTYKIVRVSTNSSSGGGDSTQSNIRAPGASGSATAVRVKMEPRDDSKGPKISGSAAGLLDDISAAAAGDAISEAPATSSVDNAALMRKLQMELADAKRAAEELEAVKQELAREKQKVKQLQREQQNTTTTPETAATTTDTELSSLSPPQPPPPPSGMITRKRKKSMRESGGEEEG